MARTLPTFPKGIETSYPWQKWGDGQIWLITQGTDFNLNTRTMASLIRRTARRHGKTARVSIRQTVIIFQLTTPPTTETDATT